MTRRRATATGRIAARGALLALGLAAAAGCARNDAREAPVAPAPPLYFQRLTGTNAAEGSPAFAPDGGRIAYERDNEIWLLDLASRSARRVAARGNHPSWSPDGAALLFVRRDLDGGGPLHRLVRVHLASGAIDTVSADTIDVYEPAAGPIGGVVALRTLSRVNTLQSLRVVGPDGAPRTTLTAAGPWVDTSPAWSVDGNWIAFVRLEDGGAARLLRVLAEGDGEATALAPEAAGISGPAWHPDGRIVFSRQGVISAVAATGGATAVLVGGEGFALDPTISPDGTRLVFASDRSGNFELWMLHDPAGIGPGPYRL